MVLSFCLWISCILPSVSFVLFQHHHSYLVYGPLGDPSLSPPPLWDLNLLFFLQHFTYSSTLIPFLVVEHKAQEWRLMESSSPWTVATCYANFMVLNSTWFTSDKEVSMMPLLPHLHGPGQLSFPVVCNGLRWASSPPLCYLLWVTPFTAHVHVFTGTKEVLSHVWCFAVTEHHLLHRQEWTVSLNSDSHDFSNMPCRLCQSSLGPQNQKTKWSRVPERFKVKFQGSSDSGGTKCLLSA